MGEGSIDQIYGLDEGARRNGNYYKRVLKQTSLVIFGGFKFQYKTFAIDILPHVVVTALLIAKEQSGRE